MSYIHGADAEQGNLQTRSDTALESLRTAPNAIHFDYCNGERLGLWAALHNGRPWRVSPSLVCLDLSISDSQIFKVEIEAIRNDHASIEVMLYEPL
jgi:hypothetical protein